MTDRQRIDYEGRRFVRPEDRSDPQAPVATYHQRGDLVWAEFSGGEVRRGALNGTCAEDGSIEFTYSMVLAAGEVVAGRSISVPHVLADGRIRLHERWERYGAHAASGTSYLEEVSG
jgi:hypothetical protein